MLTDAQRDFLAGLRVEKSGASVIEIIDANGDGVAPVRWLSREMRYAEALEQADLIVAACHDAATWGEVIEAAKELYQVRREYVSVVRGGGDEETERDPIREAFANYEHASAALVNCALKVAAALKEGSDATR